MESTSGDDSEIESDDVGVALEERNRLLDEFDDVNDGEKWMMKLWNQFVAFRPTTRLVHGGMFATCQTFIEKHGDDIAAMRLRNNFILHLTNLYNFGLLKAPQLQALISQYGRTVEGISADATTTATAIATTTAIATAPVAATATAKLFGSSEGGGGVTSKPPGI
jgi:hypothetical protein